MCIIPGFYSPLPIILSTPFLSAYCPVNPGEQLMVKDLKKNTPEATNLWEQRHKLEHDLQVQTQIRVSGWRYEVWCKN